MDTEAHDLSHRSRRRTTIAVIIVAILVATGSVAALVRARHHQGQPILESSSVVAPAPAGSQWLGVGRAVVAVPKGWPVIPAVYCSGPTGPYVTITRWHVVAGCAATQGHGHPASPPVIGLSGTASGHFQVALGGTDVPRDLTLLSLKESRTILPPGWLAVPSGEPYGGVGDPTVTSESDALEAAGFRVRVERGRPDRLGRAITTSPGIGTPARIGSTVVVHDRGAVASSARLSGRLLWVGGPLGNPPHPHRGMVRVESADGAVDLTVAAGSDGRWSLALPPGTYRLAATSPGYLTKAGTPDGCPADRQVTVARKASARVDLHCQLR